MANDALAVEAYDRLRVELLDVAASLRKGVPAPVNLPKICQAMGIDLTERLAGPGLEGSYSEVSGRRLITIYRARHMLGRPLQNREAFTVAHELGHAVVAHTHPHLSSIRNSGLAWRDKSSLLRNLEEGAVDVFAAALLVARADVARCGGAPAADPETWITAVHEIARTCGVSDHVAARRLTEGSFGNPTNVSAFSCRIPSGQVTWAVISAKSSFREVSNYVVKVKSGFEGPIPGGWIRHSRGRSVATVCYGWD